jgi:hypothetical protein
MLPISPSILYVANSFPHIAETILTPVANISIQGNVSFINYVGDEELGSLYIENLLLVPGNNVVNISASMNQIAIVSLVRSPEYCKDGVIPFKLLGDNVTNHGENISYFAAALASANQTVPIDIAEIIRNDLNTTISCANDD